MKFGINILNFGPRADPETLSGWARFAEEIGFHFMMISDHVAITPSVNNQFPAPFYDPFVTLGWLAGQTKQIELGTTVAILPYRHPLNTARMATNLDQISNGRFILGVGIGWAKDEFDTLGVPHSKRGALSNEYLEVILDYLNNDITSYAGEFVSFQNVTTTPRSARLPRLPVWVGGSSDAAIRRAAKYGDSWHPYRARVDWLRDVAMSQLTRYAAEAERPTPNLSPRIPLHVTEDTLPENKRVAGQGTMEQIRLDLDRLAELGADYVLLDTFIGQADERLLRPEADWEMLAKVAEQLLDLKRETLR